MTNHTTLAQLAQMAESDVSALPICDLAMLLEAVAENMTHAKRLNDKLNAALHAKFGGFAKKSRDVLGKDTGRVRWDEGDDYTVAADLPSVVDWDQVEMAKAIEQVRSWGEDPAQYCTSVHKVPETKWKSWPDSISKVFAPARTVRAGRPSYEIIARKREAA